MRRFSTVVMITTASLLSLAVAGCAQQRRETRRDATVAALAKYPGNPQRNDRNPVAAIDYRGQKRLEILNLGDSPVANPTVWVNKTYVAKIPTIPARGSATLKYLDLIQQGQGVKDLSVTNEPVTTVELQTDDGLYSALGPARK